MRIKSRTPRPKTIYGAEMYGVWIAATLARPGDTIVLDNKAITKAVKAVSLGEPVWCHSWPLSNVLPSSDEEPAFGWRERRYHWGMRALP